MTDFTADQTSERGFGNPIARFFSAIWNGLIHLAEQNARVRALNTLAETSDEELAARGLTREAATRRIVSEMLYI